MKNVEKRVHHNLKIGEKTEEFEMYSRPAGLLCPRGCWRAFGRIETPGPCAGAAWRTSWGSGDCRGMRTRLSPWFETFETEDTGQGGGGGQLCERAECDCVSSWTRVSVLGEPVNFRSGDVVKMVESLHGIFQKVWSNFKGVTATFETPGLL